MLFIRFDIIILQVFLNNFVLFLVTFDTWQSLTMVIYYLFVVISVAATAKVFSNKAQSRKQIANRQMLKITLLNHHKHNFVNLTLDRLTLLSSGLIASMVVML